MNWKKQLLEIEKDFGFHKERDWIPAIDSVNKLLIEYPRSAGFVIPSLLCFELQMLSVLLKYLSVEV